jgi:hypothetical protein
MMTNLETPIPPENAIDSGDHGDSPEKSWPIEYFEEHALTPALKEVIKDVNRALCENVQVIKFADGRFCLVWEELHPEMVSENEYMAAVLGPDWWHRYEPEREADVRKERRVAMELLQSTECKLSLTRHEAFALLANCFLGASSEAVRDQSEFAAEIDELLA